MPFAANRKNRVIVFVAMFALLVLVLMQGHFLPNSSALQAASATRNSDKDSENGSGTSTGKPEDAIITANTTTQRSLWAGENKALNAISLDAGASSFSMTTDNLEDIVVDNARGIIWVGTHNEIIQYTIDGKEKYKYSLKRDADAKQGKSEQGLEEGSKEDDETDDHTSEDTVHLSLDPSDGSLWIGAGHEVIKLSFDHREVFRMRHLKHIADISVDISNGSCWVGLNRMIKKYSPDGTSFLSITLEKDSTIQALAADPTTQSLWIGTNKGLRKVDSAGTEQFRTDGPAQIKDLKTDITNGSLWLVTTKQVYKYSKEGQRIFGSSLCSKNDDDENEQENKDSNENNEGTHNNCENSAQHNEAVGQGECKSNLITLAVDSVDGTCWVAWHKTLLKLNDKGEELFRSSGFKQITALDIGIPKLGIIITEPLEGTLFTETSTITVKGTVTDPAATVSIMGSKGTITGLQFEVQNVLLSEGINTLTATAINVARQSATDTIHVIYQAPAKNPPLFLCPEPYGEQRPHAPVPGCAQQRLIGKLNWDRAYVLGSVNDSINEVTLDRISMPYGVSVYNQGRIINGIWTGTYFWALMRLSGSDGVYPVSAVARNAAGIISTATVTFTKDTVYPQIAITEPITGAVTGSRTIVVRGTVDDPAAILKNDWTGETIPVHNGTFSATYELEPYDGQQYVYVSATDPASNTTYEFRPVVLDTTPPQITILAPEIGAVTNISTMIVRGNLVDQNPDTLSVSINNGAPQAITVTGTEFIGTVTFANGSNNLFFQAKDKIGNRSEMTRPVILDLVPPVAAIISPLPSSSLSGTVTISTAASDALTGMQNMTLLLDGQVLDTLTKEPYNIMMDSRLFSAGSHTITARAMDKAGNLAETSVPVNIQSQLGIEITEPSSGVTINKTSVIVKGKLARNTDKEAGVLINGVLAHVQGNDFAAIIRLQEGQNTITATALDADGLTAESVITINSDNQQEHMRLTVNPSSRAPTIKADGSMSFTASMTAEAYLPNAAASYSWDINGDGIADQTGALLTQITATYQDPGLYFPVVTVTDEKGNVYTETAIVNVLDRNRLDTLLKGKWDGMRAALVNQDISTAIDYFSNESKQLYRDIYLALGGTLPSLVQEMQDIQMIYLRNNAAKYRIRKNELYGGQMMTVTYYVYFAVGENGLWQIYRF